MGFPRQEYWSRLPFPSPGDLTDPGIELESPALQADSLPSEPPGKIYIYIYLNHIAIHLKLIQHCKLLFSHSVMSNSLRPHGLQHTRLPCPSPPPGACSNSCPLHQWCHPTILSSVVHFSSRLPSFPASESFPVNQLFTSGGQSIGASASASVPPMNIQGWFPLGFTGLIFLQSKGLSRVFSNTTVQKHQFFSAQPSSWSSSHIHTWLLEKPYLWLYRPLLAK